MKVLLVSHTCQSTTEGQPRAEWLARLGIDMHVLVPDRWLHYGRWRSAIVPTASQATYHRGRVWWPHVGPAQFYLHWYPHLASLLRDVRPDIIDLWEEPWGLVSAQACWLRDRVLPACRIVSETEQNINKSLPFPFEAFRRYVLSRADQAVGRNQEAVQILRHKGFKGPAEVVPNAVDETLFSPGPAADLKIPGFLVGYVGRWVEEKGLEEAVRALPLCSERVHLVLIGSGPAQDMLRTLASSIGVADRVVFVAGRPQDELPALMRALDVLVLPSRTTPRWKEQFGRVIIEAQACGVPVIGTSSGAIPEVIGEFGLVVPERDPVALAGALRRMVEDAALRQHCSEGGRRRVLQLFTWQRVAERMAAIYEATLRR